MRVQLIELYLSDGRVLNAVVEEFARESDPPVQVVKLRCYKGFEDPSFRACPVGSVLTEPDIEEGDVVLCRVPNMGPWTCVVKRVEGDQIIVSFTYRDGPELLTFPRAEVQLVDKGSAKGSKRP